jgi:hypothetical protein
VRPGRAQRDQRHSPPVRHQGDQRRCRAACAARVLADAVAAVAAAHMFLPRTGRWRRHR